MVRDIFTLRPLEKPGLEHVLPSLLGGRLARRDLIEQTTNNLLGSSIEPALVNAFKFLLNALQLKSRRGKTVSYNLESAEEPRYRLASGFKPELKQTGISERIVDGKSIISITARDENEARRWIKIAQKKYGQLNLSTTRASLKREFVSEPLEHEVLIGGPLQLRAIAKTAFEGCAIAIGNLAICDSPFNPIRDWIFDGANNYESFQSGLVNETTYYCNHDYRSEVWAGLPVLENAPFQHRVFVISGADVGGAWGAVELFGHFRFTVFLCDDARISIGKFGYLVDPISGKEERTPIFESAVQARFINEREGALPEFLTAFVSLMDAVARKHQFDLIEDITETAIANISFSEGKVVDESHTAALSQKLANELVHHWFRIDREEPIEPANVLPPDVLQVEDNDEEDV